ncbi:MAG: hypothetical protein ACM33U_07585 [Solirubrobacterales bacterium]|nr:hypothetical protein [Solirubrobacterales bacterium]
MSLIAACDPSTRSLALVLLRAAPEQPANMRLTGLRGVGKTVLLGDFQELAEADNWVAGLKPEERAYAERAKWQGWLEDYYLGRRAAA